MEYGDGELDHVVEALERTEAHLTAAIVSRDVDFQNKVKCDSLVKLCIMSLHFSFLCCVPVGCLFLL